MAPPKRSSAAAGANAAANQFCCVCNEDLDGDDGDDDPLVSCRDCGMWVHAQCYGEKALRVPLAKAVANPVGALLCDLCKAQRGADDTPPCLLCGYANTDNRAMKFTYGGPDAENTDAGAGEGGGSSAKKRKQQASPPDVEGWAHITCVQYVRNVGFFDAEGKSGVCGIAAVEKGRWKLRCLLCAARGIDKQADDAMQAFVEASKSKKKKKQARGKDDGGEDSGSSIDASMTSLMSVLPYATPHGAPIQCVHSTCHIAFHPLCARTAGWTLNVEEIPDGLRFRAYCGAHSEEKDLTSAAVYESPCIGCGGMDRPEESLLCEGCNATCHFDCVAPHPLPGVPWYDWYCDACIGSRVPAGTLMAVPLGPIPASANNAATAAAASKVGKKGRGKASKAAAASAASWPPIRYQPVTSQALDALPLPAALAGARDGDEEEAYGRPSSSTASAGGRNTLLYANVSSSSVSATTAIVAEPAASGQRFTRGSAAAIVAEAARAMHSDDEDDEENGEEEGSDNDSGDGEDNEQQEDEGEDDAGFTRRGRGRQAAAAVVTSARGAAAALSRKRGPLPPAPPYRPMELAEAQAILASQPPQHELSRGLLMHELTKSFPEWAAYMRAGSGLVFYGFGSKAELVRAFAARAAPDARLLEVCGHSSLLTLRAVLEEIRKEGEALGALAGARSGSRVAPEAAVSAADAAPGKRLRKRAKRATELTTVPNSSSGAAAGAASSASAPAAAAAERGGVIATSLRGKGRRGRPPKHPSLLTGHVASDDDDDDISADEDGIGGDAPNDYDNLTGGADAGATVDAADGDYVEGEDGATAARRAGLAAVSDDDGEDDSGSDSEDDGDGAGGGAALGGAHHATNNNAPSGYAQPATGYYAGASLRRYLRSVRAASRARLAAWPAPYESDSSSDSDSSDGDEGEATASRRARRRRAAVDAVAGNAPGVRLIVLVRGIDGHAFRAPGAIAALIRAIQAVPGARLLATTDHINAPLLFNASVNDRGSLRWIPATTYLPYSQDELAWLELSDGREGGGASTKTGLMWVLRSLTPALRKILRLIMDLATGGGGGGNSNGAGGGDAEADDDEDYVEGADAGSSKKGAKSASASGGGFGSVAFDALLEACRDELILNTDTQLRQHLVELHDHELTAGRGARVVLLSPPDKLKEALDAQDAAAA